MLAGLMSRCTSPHDSASDNEWHICRRICTTRSAGIGPKRLIRVSASTPSTELTAEEGQQLVADIGQIAVETVSCRALAEDAHALANATGRTAYDSMYVALAVRLNTRLITADDRLEAALKGIPAVAGHIQLVQTFERDVQASNDPDAPE
jgi:hypothetical protein